MEGYLSAVAPIIEEAGIDLMQGFGKTEAVVFKSAAHGSAVTELDRKTERFIAERLRKIYPDIAYFGEEFGGDNEAERFWLVDPIDGTSNFIRGLPFSTTMIALIQEGRPVFSIIYNFMTKELYSATRDKGATLNGAPIHVSARPVNHACVFAETDKHKKENIDKYIKINEKFSIYAASVSGFEFAMVASGKIEGRATFGDPPGKDWDYAPGALLVAEAGGIVKNIGKTSYDYRNHDFVAGNQPVCEELEKILL